MKQHLNPEFTWALCQVVFWSGVVYTVLCHYLGCHDAKISSVIATKAQDNYWVPVVLVGLCIHWLWPNTSR